MHRKYISKKLLSFLKLLTLKVIHFNGGGITPSNFGSQLSELSGECSLNYLKQGQKTSFWTDLKLKKNCTASKTILCRKQEKKHIKDHMIDLGEDQYASS